MANKCLTGGNKEQDEQETRYGKQQHPTTKTQLKMGKTSNRKPYSKFLMNLGFSFCTRKYLPSVFSYRPSALVIRSVEKPRVNTFP